MPKRPIVTLLTDFGLADPYVAEMKGVILSIQPLAATVDITHQIPPGDVLAGAAEANVRETLAACESSATTATSCPGRPRPPSTGGTSWPRLPPTSPAGWT